MTDPRPRIVVALKAVAILAMGLYLLHLMTAGTDEQVTDHRPVEQRGAKALDKCVEAPEDIIPGHVVWQHPDGRTVYSKALTGPALDTTFADGDLPGRPIAFCL